MYKFELEKILEIRKHIEDSIKAEFNAIENLINNEKKHSNELKRRRENLSMSIEEKMTQGSSSKEYVIYADFIAKISMDLNNSIINIIEMEKQRENKRQELINAVKNRKSLENLKIKRTNEYNKRLQRIETINLDEFASSQYIRRMETT